MMEDFNNLMKRNSVEELLASEGNVMFKDCFKGNKIAVLTSGGDSQGMNSVVRSVVRMGIYCGCQTYIVHEGYQGLVDGKENIVEATWACVSGIIQMGGTVIGSARCQDFRSVEGRKTAALNMVKVGINNLVVIGGDGSLTGADLFRNEWSDLLKDLESEGSITSGEKEKYGRLNVVGIVGSIDNDFCGTDMTIGTDSALHRIMESCDIIKTTAYSHKRCFVIEVMGRHCGYLALIASLTCEADWMFIPEMPPVEGWEEVMCNKLKRNKESGQRVNIVIIAEGAIDRDGNPISANNVKDIITKGAGLDTRVTVLGHLQRGGSPSTFDRILGIRFGVEAVMALLETKDRSENDSYVIGIHANEIVRGNLMDCVAKTKAVTEAMQSKQYDLALKLRGKSFEDNYRTYEMLSDLDNAEEGISKGRKRFGIINVGAPCSGINAVSSTFTRLMAGKGYRVVGINNGFKGLIGGKYEQLTKSTVHGWVGEAGSKLGTKTDTAEDVGIERVAKCFTKYKLSGLLIVGGYNAYLSTLQLANAREKFPCFKIPILCIPATTDNNIPGSHFSIGTDTALNELTKMMDKIKLTADAAKRRTYVLETLGGYCGYLATMSGLACGADNAFVYEEKFGIKDILTYVKNIKNKIAHDVPRGLVVMGEKASDFFNADFVSRLIEEQTKTNCDVKIIAPDDLMLGGCPTPFDRNNGIKLAAKSAIWFETVLNNKSSCSEPNENATLIGVEYAHTHITPVVELMKLCDADHKIPLRQWWLKLRPILEIMARHPLTNLTEDDTKKQIENFEFLQATKKCT